MPAMDFKPLITLLAIVNPLAIVPFFIHYTVDFTPEQRSALAQGGVAQVHHAFVEPRTHEFSLAFEGGDWQEAPPALVSVETPRDRLTFLEIDLGGTDSGQGGGAPAAVVWQR